MRLMQARDKVAATDGAPGAHDEERARGESRDHRRERPSVELTGPGVGGRQRRHFARERAAHYRPSACVIGFTVYAPPSTAVVARCRGAETACPSTARFARTR